MAGCGHFRNGYDAGMSDNHSVGITTIPFTTKPFKHCIMINPLDELLDHGEWPNRQGSIKIDTVLDKEAARVLAALEAMAKQRAEPIDQVLDVPGVPREAVLVEVSRCAVVVTAAHNGRNHRHVVPVTNQHDIDRVTAKYAYGTVRVSVPLKRVEEPRPRKVTVE